MRWVVRLWVLSCLLGGGACASEREARAVVLARVVPTQVEPGSTLRVEGDGLSMGSECEVELAGHTLRPGSTRLDVSLTLMGRAVSPDAVEALLHEASITALGTRGTFEGAVRIACAGRDGVATGGLQAQLDVGGLDQRDDGLRRSAAELLDFAGIVRSEEASIAAGLVIAEVRAGSPAAALELRSGDVITRAAGVAVHSLSDLAPPPHASQMALRVARPSERSERERVLQFAGLHVPDLSDEMARLSWALGFLFSCVLLFSPLPSAVPWLSRWTWRLRNTGPPRLGFWGGDIGAGKPKARRATLRQLVWPVACSVAGVALVTFEPAGILAVRSISLYLALLALSVTLALMSEGSTLRERMRVSGTIAGRMLVMGVLIACGCALYGTRSFDGMVAGQGAWPWRWALFQKPALLVAFPFYVVFASRLGATTLALDGPGGTARLLCAERVLTNVVLCALGVAIFAGGWQSPTEIVLDGVAPRLIGALLFVLKAWAFGGLLALARRIELGTSLRRREVTFGCLACVALTALWLWLQPSTGFEVALGRASCASLLCFAVVTALRVRAPITATSSAGDVLCEGS